MTHKELRTVPPGVYLFVCIALSASCARPCTPTVPPDELSDELLERDFREQLAAPPVSFDCTLYYRASTALAPGDRGDEPKFQHAERALHVGPNQRGEGTLGHITLSASYSDSPYDGSSFSLYVHDGEQALFRTLYQFARTQPPKNEFVGDHGFTGLVYVSAPSDPTGDYQFICKVGER